MKLPTIKELSGLVMHVKTCIDSDCRAHEEDTLPGIQLTCGIGNDGSWSYQTGDNSYTGSAYHYPHWAVVTVYKRSNSHEIARDILSQWGELL